MPIMPTHMRQTPEADLLLAYSEWLDGDQGLIPPTDSADNRSHEDLVREFLESRP